jgi:ribose 5-phosphate isomerase B
MIIESDQASYKLKAGPKTFLQDSLVYIASDHRGYKLKEGLKIFLQNSSVKFEDLGTNNEEFTDYPEYAKVVAQKVANTENLGILICGSGAGMVVAANKFKGIRAALAVSAEMAEHIRAEDDINILVLASDFTGTPKAENIIETFLITRFDGQERHADRLSQIEELER